NTPVQHSLDARPLPRRQVRTARQAQAEVKQTLRHLATVIRRPRKNGLQMHGLPQGPRLDILRLEGQAQALAREPAADGRIDKHTAQPAVGEKALRLLLKTELDTPHRPPGKILPVPRPIGAPLRHTLVQNLHLPPTDTRAYIAHPVVVAYLAVLVVRRRITRL